MSEFRGRTDDGQIMISEGEYKQLQARVKDLEHEIKMAKRHLRDVLSERHAIEAALSDERQKAKKLEAENAELRKFIEAKMHHLPIEDQHVASVMIQQADDEGEA